MSGAATERVADGVAIVGMNCRFPGAGNVEQFWRNLRDGVESVSFFTDEELLAAGVEPSLLENPKYVKARGLIEGIDLFDAAFFNIPPKEAELIDPQQRVFLECAWEALEGAGYSAEHYHGLIAVFAGVGPNYYLANVQANMERVAALGWYKLAIGNEKDHLTTRVSYALDLRGPSFNVQTACSTSLVAVHLACQGLLDYQYDMALAGGCTANVKAKGGYVYNEGLSSPDGHCRAFDARSGGFVSGNGVGVVVLRRLADALEDGDTIYAVIKGSAINNDGHSKAGYTAPSVEGQASVIAMAQAAAEVEPEEISYVETHGTATPLGDMIEMAALTQAFRSGTDRKGFCAIGSLKTNVGHLDTAAGVAGVIKTALSLSHGQIPPSLHFETPNPQIDFADSPFYVNRELSEWKNGGSPRRAGVSSFGLGGTNAHVILEEAPAPAPSSPSRPWQLLLLSARTEAALDRMSTNLADHLRERPGESLADAAFTLQLGRKTFAHRRAVLCRETSDAADALDTLDLRRVFTSADESTDRGVNFMFPGQGAQHVGMGLGLYRTEPVFREQLDLCCELLKPELGFDLRDVLYPADGRAGEAADRLARIDVTQPALFAVEYALAQLWMEWGLRPRAMIGYSTGEYVAACLAGVFSLKDALSLVAFRGRLMQESLPPGAMLSVPLAEDEVRAVPGGAQLSVAAVNGPSLCVVAGTPEAVDDFEKRLAERGTDCRRLRTDHAYHSSMIEPLLGRFVERLGRVQLDAPRVRFVSNVTGTWVTPGEATDPAYWARHMRQTVRFSDGARELLQESDAALLEVGPGQMLSGLLRRLARASGHPVVNSLPHPDEQCEEEEALAGALGKLWLGGVRVDWRRFYARESRRRVKLPTYPFERRRYWLDLKQQSPADRPSRSHLERRADVGEWFYLPVWKQTLAPTAPEAAGGHDPSRCWVVFEDACGVGRKLVERLRAGGHVVVTVAAGGVFARVDDATYRINPRDPSDYAALFADVGARGLTPGRVAHLWSVTGGERPAAAGREFFEGVQAAGLYSLLYVAQALIEGGFGQPPAGAPPLQLQVISNHVQRVTGAETLWPEKATIIGPCKTIPQEYNGVRCLAVDITLPEPGTWQESRLLDNLLAELQAEPSNSVVAYRGADRWAQGFDPVRLGAVSGRPPRLRERGVYLLTGGLGKDSLMRARYLAEEVRARLVLVGRTGLPERGEWERWLEAHGEEDEVSVRIRKVRELLALGAEVLVVSADVAEESQMRAVLRRVDEEFGALHGVIHAAGLTDSAASRLVMELSSVECEWQFQSKVYGLYVLAEVLRGRELDFCVLTSSVASVVGGVGLLAYTSANIFMDAFAHRHNQTEPVSWLSLNWQGATPEKTVEAFKRILAMPPATQLVVSIQDLEARIEQRIKLNYLLEAERPAAAEERAPSEQARPNLRNAYVAPGTETERQITDLWHDLLGVDWLGVNDSFLEVGGDSLLAVQLVSRLHQTFGVRLPIRSLFETPTVAGLAASVERLRAAADAPEQSAPGAASNGNGAGPHAPEGLNGGAPVARPTGGAAPALSEAAALSLVGLQTGGSRRPFFCVHPSGGNVFCFVHLARHLGDEQPFYALQSKGLNVGESPHTRVEEMAAFYLEAMRVAQPAGPYLLGGWSMGGLVAFEMARQLRERGEEVGLLALLDTQAFNQHRPTEVEETSHLINFANELALSWGLEVTWDDLGLRREDLARLKPDEQLDHVVARARQVGALPPDAELFEGAHLLKVFRGNAGAMSRYIPPAYPGPLTLIRTDDHAREVALDPTLGWGRVVGGGVDAHAVEATHYTMVREPSVREVARILAACLERAAGGS